MLAKRLYSSHENKNRIDMNKTKKILAVIGLVAICSGLFFYLGQKMKENNPEEVQKTISELRVRIKELEAASDKLKGELRAEEKSNRKLLNRLQRLVGYVTRLKTDLEKYEKTF